MTLYNVMIAFAVGMVGLLLWKNAGVRERAVGLAKQHCQQMDVQFLDDTVSLVSLRPRRDKRGNVYLARRYDFEFTATGDQRYRGELTLMGTRLYDITLEPHRIQ